MSYSLKSPIRTNKGREATETEGLVYVNNITMYYSYIIAEATTKLMQPRKSIHVVTTEQRGRVIPLESIFSEKDNNVRGTTFTGCHAKM